MVAVEVVVVEAVVVAAAVRDVRVGIAKPAGWANVVVAQDGVHDGAQDVVQDGAETVGDAVQVDVAETAEYEYGEEGRS